LDPVRAVLRNAVLYIGLIHPLHDPDRPCPAGGKSGAHARRYCRGDLRQHLPLHRLRADRRGDRARGRADARRQCAAGNGAWRFAMSRFRFVSSDRPVREARRFVVGKGRFAADVIPSGTHHVALVTSPHPAARIAVDKRAALAMPGVAYVLDGCELAAATQPLAAGLDTPKVPRRPLAVDVARYAGEWVAAVVADTRARAEDAAEHVQVTYDPLP